MALYLAEETAGRVVLVLVFSWGVGGSSLPHCASPFDFASQHRKSGSTCSCREAAEKESMNERHVIEMNESLTRVQEGSSFNI